MMFKPMNAARAEYADRRQLRADRLEAERAIGGVPPYTWTIGDVTVATLPNNTGVKITVHGVKAGSTLLGVKDVVGNAASAPVNVTAS